MQTADGRRQTAAVKADDRGQIAGGSRRLPSAVQTAFCRPPSVPYIVLRPIPYFNIDGCHVIAIENHPTL